MSHERVQDPEGDVGEQEEGDELAAGFGNLLAAGATGAAGGFRDYQTYELPK